MFRCFWSVLKRNGRAARREIAKWRALTVPGKRGEESELALYLSRNGARQEISDTLSRQETLQNTKELSKRLPERAARIPRSYACVYRAGCVLQRSETRYKSARMQSKGDRKTEIEREKRKKRLCPVASVSNRPSRLRGEIKSKGRTADMVRRSRSKGEKEGKTRLRWCVRSLSYGETNLPGDTASFPIDPSRSSGSWSKLRHATEFDLLKASCNWT